MEETRQKAGTDAGSIGASLYAAAANPGGNPDKEEQKRHDRPVHHCLPAIIPESVNSSGDLSEKRHTTVTVKSTGSQNPEQQYSNHSMNARHRGAHKGHQSEASEVANSQINKEIPASAFASMPARPPSQGKTALVSLVSEAELKKLVRVLRSTSLSKRNSVFLTLDLKELGEVKLDVTLKGKKVFITAHITDRRAAAALSFAIGELKRQLSGIDLSLEQFEISRGYRRAGSVEGQHNNGTTVSTHAGLR
ncbi:MAG: flagellar hook-length control protein FliK [Deltaproteobacteria bacterium]|nr:flagellar hook-length control protein FliK [Deltaproteobacteria bacterium]